MKRPIVIVKRRWVFSSIGIPDPVDMKSDNKHLRIALLFLAPNLIGFLCFTLVPVLISLAGSFTTWSLRPSVPLEFVGLDNYLYLLKDKDFYFYFYNTIFMMLGAPISIAGSLFLAIVLHEKMKFRKFNLNRRLAFGSLGLSTLAAILLSKMGSPNAGCLILFLGIVSCLGILLGSVAYRSFLYLPHFAAGAATVILWQQMYNPNFGFINQFLELIYRALDVHWSLPGWLTSTRTILGFIQFPQWFSNGGFGLGARESIIIMVIWGAVGGNNMLLYLAGISNIPPELYEAGDIDGCSAWQKFKYITWPQLAPTTFFISVMAIIGGLQGGFEQARLMTQGGPAGTTTTLSYYIYLQGFERLDLGYGSAVAWVLFILIFGVTLLNWKYGKGEAH